LLDVVCIAVAFITYSIGDLCAVSFMWDAISNKFNKTLATWMTVSGSIYLFFMCVWGVWYEFGLTVFVGIGAIIFLVGLIMLAFVSERGFERKRLADGVCWCVQLLLGTVFIILFVVHFCVLI